MILAQGHLNFIDKVFLKIKKKNASSKYLHYTKTN